MTVGKIITVEGLTKKFKLYRKPSDRIFEALSSRLSTSTTSHMAINDISFSVNSGEVFGILGKNGSGKSTLLKVICGVLKPTSGVVICEGRISALLELGAGFNPELTGRKNAENFCELQGLDAGLTNQKLGEIEEFADIGQFFDLPMKLYSSGMFVRVAFAAAINVEPDILIIDEALSVGDSRFQNKCFDKIKSFVEQNKTMIFVSHSADALLNICDRGAVLDSGKLVYSGEIRDCVNKYQEILYRPDKESDQPQPIKKVLNTATQIHNKNLTNLSDNPLYNPSERRLGLREVEIVSCSLFVDNEIYQNQMVEDFCDFEIIFKLFFHSEKNNVNVGFGVTTVEGVYVFGTNAHMLKQPLINAEKGDEVIVSFKFKSNFIRNEYFINLGCEEIRLEEVVYQDVRRSVLHLMLGSDPTKSGFTNLNVDYKQLRQ